MFSDIFCESGSLEIFHTIVNVRQALTSEKQSLSKLSPNYLIRSICRINIIINISQLPLG